MPTERLISGFAFRVENRSRTERSPVCLGGRLSKFLGRQASVQERSTHRHRLEGAMIAPFVPLGAGIAQQNLDK